MPKRPINPPKLPRHSWAIYLVKSTPAKLVGIVHDRPDAGAAIEAAIREYGVPPNERSRLMARRLMGRRRD